MNGNTPTKKSFQNSQRVRLETVVTRKHHSIFGWWSWWRRFGRTFALSCGRRSKWLVGLFGLNITVLFSFVISTHLCPSWTWIHPFLFLLHSRRVWTVNNRSSNAQTRIEALTFETHHGHGGRSTLSLSCAVETFWVSSVRYSSATKRAPQSRLLVCESTPYLCNSSWTWKMIRLCPYYCRTWLTLWTSWILCPFRTSSFCDDALSLFL